MKVVYNFVSLTHSAALFELLVAYNAVIGQIPLATCFQPRKLTGFAVTRNLKITVRSRHLTKALY